MILLLAETDDALAAAANERLAASGRAVTWLDEGELTSGMPFALERRGPEVSGYLRAPGGPGGKIALGEIAGALIRLPRRWMPADFDAADQRFVFHETTAALFAFVAALSGPVVNRYGLWWWLRDESYPRQLLADLAGRLGTTAGEPTAVEAPAPFGVYMAGDRFFAAGESGERAERARRWMGERADALAAWQRATGVAFCRLDLEGLEAGEGGDPQLAGVDPTPSLAAEPPALVERIAAAVVELLS